nr:hypothetical protein BgiMline_007015 [Biomphalaria glabrata]
MNHSRFVVSSAESLLREYSKASTARPEMTQQQFAQLLKVSTSHKMDFIQNVLGVCLRKDRNCTWKAQVGLPASVSPCLSLCAVSLSRGQARCIQA